VYFSKERYISGLVSRVEVLGRTGKLPVIYAEAAASHMLGLLRVKFSPIWSAAVKALVALAKGHEDCVWPPAQAMISSLMNSFPYRDSDAMADIARPEESPCDPATHYQLCIDWETSGGKNASIFFGDIERAKEGGMVSRHRNADEATVLQSLWDVFEEAPHLLLSHSRTMVPIVLQFLHCQYFTLHPEDADARELDLSEHVTEKR
jgi:hypothetical protein